MHNQMEISEFVGKTFTLIKGCVSQNDSIEFYTDSEVIKMYHSQDCCESVYLDDVVGDPNDLIGTPIVEAYQEDSTNVPVKDDYEDSFTWTFYRLRTVKGTVTLKWYGSSNGYYSESVDIDSRPL